MSPEQMRGERRNIDRRSDLYSLGLVLYELLVGHSPDGFASEAEPPSHYLGSIVSPDLDRVILRAIREVPDERYQTAEQFRADLRQLVAQKNRERRSYH
jgi:serine/threonine-protein kinase